LVCAHVVEQHVDAAEFLFRGGKDAGAVLGLADVCGDADDLSFAFLRELLAGILQHIGAARDDRHASAGLHEVRRGGIADAHAAAGDQRTASIHSHFDHSAIPSE
jgi:hypothetical protein